MLGMEQAATLFEPETTSLDLTDGRDELNLAEFPLFFLGQRLPAGQKTLSYETQVYDQASNRTFTRKLEITGADAYGLPTVRDADVLLALLLLGKEANKLTSPTVAFSRYELAQILGWDDCGATYQRISEALFKWLGVTLKFEKSFWDKGQQRWRTLGFHILEAVEMNDVVGRRKQMQLPFSSCRFSDEFFGSILNGNIKKLNLADYFHLSVPAAKQMYRFLDKRFYNQHSLDFDLRTFACEHVGLSKNYPPRKLKEKLQPGIRELEEMGFIKAVGPGLRYSKVGHGEYRIHFQYGKRDALPKPLTGNKATRSVNRHLLKELTDRGVTATVASDLIESKTISHEQIHEKIELLDWYLSERPQEAPKRPGGWLVTAIKQDFTPPNDFKTKARREAEAAQIDAAKKSLKQAERAREEQEIAQRELNSAKEAAEWQAIQDHLALLSEDERQSLIEAAINSQPIFIRKKARSCHASSTPTDQDRLYYEVALRGHILPLLQATVAEAL
jgi:hypothetical protein